MQIFVVVSQENSLSGAVPAPVAAYSDYASALTFAQTIFTATFDPGFSARDLVYMVNLTQSLGAQIVSAVTHAV